MLNQRAPQRLVPQHLMFPLHVPSNSVLVRQMFVFLMLYVTVDDIYAPLRRMQGILLCTCWSVGLLASMLVFLNIVQPITQEGFATETSNLVGRQSLMDIQVSRPEVKVKVHVGLPHLVQLVTQERFASEASNLVGR